MTLYVFDRDAGGKSACNGPCAANWPPLLVVGDGKAAGDWTIIVRDDGGKQWAYKGKPLYTWSKDTKAGRQDRRRRQQRLACGEGLAARQGNRAERVDTSPRTAMPATPTRRCRSRTCWPRSRACAAMRGC